MFKIKREKDRFNTPAGRVFDVFNIIILGIFGFVTLVPFLFVIAGSFATEVEITTRHFFIIPQTFTTEAYSYIFETGNVVRSLFNTIGVTIVGTIVQLIVTFSMAYPLSRKHLKGRSFLISIKSVNSLKSIISRWIVLLFKISRAFSAEVSP